MVRHQPIGRFAYWPRTWHISVDCQHPAQPWCVRLGAEHSFGPAVDRALGCNELYRALPGFFGDLWKAGSLLLCGSKVHPVARPCLPTRHPEAAEPTVSVKKKQRTTRGPPMGWVLFIKCQHDSTGISDSRLWPVWIVCFCCPGHNEFAIQERPHDSDSTLPSVLSLPLRTRPAERYTVAPRRPGT